MGLNSSYLYKYINVANRKIFLSFFTQKGNYPHNINLYIKELVNNSNMETSDLEYEENIARLLRKMQTYFEKVGLEDLSKKSKKILQSYFEPRDLS